MADPSKGARFPPPSNTNNREAKGAAAARSLAVGSLLAGGDAGDLPSTQAFGREELRYRVALVRLKWGLVLVLVVCGVM